MRIAQLSLAGRGAWPDLHIEQLNPRLNVFFGKPGVGKSTIAQLVGHLLYGKSQRAWREQFGQAVPLVEGQLVVDSQIGCYTLRRHLNADRTSRLTVAALNGGVVDSRTVQKLLGEISPQVLARLMAVDFSEAPSVEGLLSRDFTRELAKSCGKSIESNANGSRASSATRERTSPIDRHRVEELIRQRDLVTNAIEKRLSMRRQEGDVLNAELDEVVLQLETTRQQFETIQSDALVVAREIAECELRLRYVSLEKAITNHASEINVEPHRLELEQLETEITRCRQALGDLQTREATVRAELAQLTPDGTADRVRHLADSRNTVHALERLIDDLDAEVALLARAHEPAQGVDYDSHARLSPVAAMLRQQVYTLCGLITEQQRASRRHQLTTESRHLSRSQHDLGERLEHLLERREWLVHELNVAGKIALLRPQTPALEYCRCEQHAEFVSHADPLLVGYGTRHTQEAGLRDRYDSLLRRRDELERDADQIAAKQRELENRWQTLQRERGGLVGKGGLEELRSQLEQLETKIQEALTPAEVEVPVSPICWRASDILSQLTDGKLVQIRLERGGRTPVVIDHRGHLLEPAALSTAAHDQLYLALTLALVGSFRRRGIQLPLILDEPFLRQDATGSAVMAGLLAEFARAGHQVLVFTEDRDALRRFEALDSQVFDLLRMRSHADPTEAPPPATVETAYTRIVRETEDGELLPVVRFRSTEAVPELQFYLTEASPLAEFPVLGTETAKIFGNIGIETVAQLLTTDAAVVARELNRMHITAETVALWQAHMRLMCGIAGLTLDDAQVLAACGVRYPADLRKAAPAELEATILDFLQSERGQRFAGYGSRFTALQIGKWARSGAQGKKASPRIWKEEEPALTDPTKLYSPSLDVEPLEFFLSRASHVANAPSISPQTAQLLATVGIRTVADLLDAEPDSVAAQIGTDRISSQAISQWQLQSQLMCQIPDLRGYAAQLLVACGFTSPTQITSISPADLIRRVQDFCKSKQGERILRGHEIPAATKIKTWAQNAAQHRPLEAA